VLSMLVGDTQRIWVYADQGFAERQPVTPNVEKAYKRLVQAGFRHRLIQGGSATDLVRPPKVRSRRS
jgi:hypothetical protein